MIQKIARQRYFYHLIFFVVLLIQFFFYDYFTMIDELPVSVHMWRQSDCLSFVMNYYQNGMDPLKPQIHHVLAGNGYTVAEFPAMYYLVALGYHIFGPHEWVYRLIWMLTLAAGLFCFYRTLLIFLKDQFWAIGISALLFCSPVLAFYGNSFIIDPAALSFTLIAWYFFAQFMLNRKRRWLVLSILTFLFAGLLKEPALISFVALTGLWILWWLVEWQKTGRRPKISPAMILLFFLPALGGLVWFFVKQHYNELHQNVAFLAEIRPIWEISPEKINEIATQIKDIWLDDYFEPLTLILTALLFITNLFFFGKNWMINLFSVVMLLGAISFMLLFYWQFRNHDYYIINVLLVIPVTWMVFVRNMEKWTIHSRKASIYIKIAFSVILLLNILHVDRRLEKRMERTWHWAIPSLQKMHHMKEAREYLTSLGVQPSDKIISIPDETMNLTLYLLNQPGWTNVYNRNKTAEDINYHASQGARYLVVNAPEELQKPYLQPFLDKRIGVYKELTVFRLMPLRE